MPDDQPQVPTSSSEPETSPDLDALPLPVRRLKLGRKHLVGGGAAAGAATLIYTLWSLGVINFSSRPDQPPAVEDVGPPKPKLGERVSALEERVSELKAVVSETRDKLGGLSERQVKIETRTEDTQKDVQRIEADQRARFDRLFDKLDDLRDDVRRRGR